VVAHRRRSETLPRDRAGALLVAVLDLDPQLAALGDRLRHVDVVVQHALALLVQAGLHRALAALDADPCARDLRALLARRPDEVDREVGLEFTDDDLERVAGDGEVAERPLDAVVVRHRAAAGVCGGVRLAGRLVVAATEQQHRGREIGKRRLHDRVSGVNRGSRRSSAAGTGRFSYSR
jgi:hypothetical protein